MPVIQLELDSTGAVSSLQKFDRAVDNTQTTTTSKFAAIAGGVAAAAAAMAAAVGAAMIVVAKQSIDAAARMEETQNKYDAVFEGMTDTSDAWVKDLRDNYMLSERGAKEYLAATKAILDGTKMQTEEAAKLSSELVKVAQDLSSFHDKTQQQAVDAMTSALTGEYEAMKKFGIVIKKSEIIQRAMIDNNLENKDAVTQAMEAQAAYALIIEKSGKAIGDTARSQASYVSQMKQFDAIVEDVKVLLGESLLPIVTQLITEFNQWYKTNEDLIQSQLLVWIDNIIIGMKTAWEWAGKAYDQFARFAAMNPLAMAARTAGSITGSVQSGTGLWDTIKGAASSAFDFEGGTNVYHINTPANKDVIRDITAEQTRQEAQI